MIFNVAKHKTKFLMTGLFVVALACASIFGLGLKPGIDFTGGAIIELKSPNCVLSPSDDNANQLDCDSTLSTAFNDAGVELESLVWTESESIVLKTKPIDVAKWEEVKAVVSEQIAELEEVRFEAIGPVLGAELLQKTTTAVILAISLLLIYIGWRFKNWQYGLTAIIALFHDLLVIVGLFAIFGRYFGVEVDVMFVTATLTAIAFSVHDTIVLYDRIRETIRRHPNDEFSQVVNLAINGTIIRSLSTSLSILFVLVAMFVLGGESIRWFVMALLIGTVSGAYSSPFIAAPLLLFLKDRKRSAKKQN